MTKGKLRKGKLMKRRYDGVCFVPEPVAGIRLKGHKKDFEKARQRIREWDAGEGILRDAVRCPQCSSSRVEYPQFTRKFFLPNLVGLASLLHIIDKEFYCQECEYTWPKEARPPWPRKHGAPYYFIEEVPRTNPASGGRAAQK